MTCNLCQIPTSESPLPASILEATTGGTDQTPSQDTTIMLACGNCNVNNFGPPLSSAPAKTLSKSYASASVTSLTQDYFNKAVSPAPSSNCAKTLPTSVGTPYACGWVETTEGNACGTTTSSSVMTIGAAAPF